MTQKDIFGNETKFFEKASFFNGADISGNLVVNGKILNATDATDDNALTDINANQVNATQVNVGTAVTISAGIITATTINATDVNTSVVTSTNGSNLNGYKVENGKQDSSTSLNGEFDFDLASGHIHRYSAATGGNYHPNFIVNSSQSLTSIMDVGDVVAATVIVASSSHFCSNTLKIDGSAAGITTSWISAAIPSAANGSGFDIYSFTIMKISATPEYHIVGNVIAAASA